ncbi:MAG TPA: cyanophycin synthetase [Flavobacteriales bacterium]|nr:cyanophycin synthetase [Flavobacteriales bacterium]
MEKKHTSAPLRIVGGQLLEARRAAMSAHGPHRLEPVATVNDVLYINDSKATFLDASLESLASVENRVVWIVGAWSDDMAEGHVQELLMERVASVVFYGPPLGEVEGIPEHVFQAEELRTAVFLAHELAKPGEVVLFSPACPSGNGFANYEERGAEFKRAVKDL